MENYQQVRVLGKGSFGAAWLVKRKKDGAQFVAKEVKLTALRKEEREAAKHEVSMLRSLTHPNITRYIDHFESRGSLFIVMEYANGGDLYTKIQSRRGVRMSERDVLHYFCQLTLALYHMHERRVLHRDLKTQNVFLTSDGVVKLGDFGISTVLRNTYELKRTVCGTPYYFSPELCMNKPYNNKSDIWALGCILYELTTLKHAFDGASMQALVQRILRGVYPPIDKAYSRELRDLIAAMLSTDPAKRPHIAAIVQLPFIRKAMEALQKEVKVANDEKRSFVDPQQQKSDREAALQRAQEEKEARAKKEAEWKAQQVMREKEHKDRVEQMKLKMQQEVKEHEQRVQRAREKDRAEKERDDRRRAEADERRKVEQADRQQKLEEVRRLQQKRQAEQDAANRRREQEWERNMKDAREEAERRAALRREQDEQAERQRQADADDRARVFRENRALAQANKQRLADDERRAAAVYQQQQQQQPPAPAEPDPYARQQQQQQRQQIEAEDRARVYREMRAQAMANKQRAAEDARPQVQPPPLDPSPYHHPQRTPDEPPPQKAKPQAEYDAVQAAQAYREMRARADANRQRLMEDRGVPLQQQQQQQQQPPSAAVGKPLPPAPGTPVPRQAPEHLQTPPAQQQRKQATPSAEDERRASDARTQAFWEMRKAAEMNKRRLLGNFDPSEEEDTAATPAVAAAPPAASPAPSDRRNDPSPNRGVMPPRAEKRPETGIVPPGVLDRQQHQPSSPAVDQPGQEPRPTPPVTPAGLAADGFAEDTDDEDGDIGYHKFLNNDAAAEADADAEEPVAAQQEKHAASRQADYTGVMENISQMLNDPDKARMLDTEDFSDPQDPSHFMLDGVTIRLPNVNEEHPLGHRIETLRLYLEEALGLDKFISAYRLLSNDLDGDGTSEKDAAEVIGAELAKYVGVIVQLIVCEEAFAREQNSA